MDASQAFYPPNFKSSAERGGHGDSNVYGADLTNNDISNDNTPRNNP